MTKKRRFAQVLIKVEKMRVLEILVGLHLSPAMANRQLKVLSVMDTDVPKSLVPGHIRQYPHSGHGYWQKWLVVVPEC